MRTYADYKEFPRPHGPCVVAIGSFDGLHRGHQLLLERVCERAKNMGLLAGAMTFKPHPAKVLAPRYSPPLLMPHERRLRALERLGLDFTLAQHFDKDFAAIPADAFSRDILAESLGAEAVVVGDDFSFGANREGLADDLVAFGRRDGYEVDVVRRLAVEGMIVSSTRIRSFLLQGNAKGAGLLLGRTYVIPGEVVAGAGRGRQIGYPTINIRAKADLLPARGVYVCHFWPPGQSEAWLGVTNIGVCPTFGPGELSVEIHILDQAVGDFAKSTVKVGFLERLRPEFRFDSVDDLCARIEADTIEARKVAGQYENRRQLDPLHGFQT